MMWPTRTDPSPPDAGHAATMEPLGEGRADALARQGNYGTVTAIAAGRSYVSTAKEGW